MFTNARALWLIRVAKVYQQAHGIHRLSSKVHIRA